MRRSSRSASASGGCAPAATTVAPGLRARVVDQLKHTLLTLVVEPLAVVDRDDRARARRRRARRDGADRERLGQRIGAEHARRADQRLQQVALAATRLAPQVDQRRASQCRALAQQAHLRQHLAVVADHEVLERRRFDAMQVERDLVHGGPHAGVGRAACAGRHLGGPTDGWRGCLRGCLRGQRRGPPAAGAPVLAPAARGCPAVLAAPAAPRNSLRSLRELRSDSRGESEVRGALRAPAGTAALLGCAQARPRRAARAFADSVAVCPAGTPIVAATPVAGTAPATGAVRVFAPNTVAMCLVTTSVLSTNVPTPAPLSLWTPSTCPERQAGAGRGKGAGQGRTRAARRGRGSGGDV